MRLAQRLSAVSLSPTLAVMMESKALKERGVDVVDFGAGEPDFDTPENIKRAAVEALRNNLTHYTDTGGLLDLRRAIAARYKERHGAGWGPDEVITGCGGKNVLFLVALSLFEAGDRVAIYAPYWVSFPEQVKLCGAAPVIIEARGGRVRVAGPRSGGASGPQGGHRELAVQPVRGGDPPGRGGAARGVRRAHRRLADFGRDLRHLPLRPRDLRLPRV